MKGGARPNAGRKKGVPNKTTVERLQRRQALIEKAEAEGILPLELMLATMRKSWEAGNETEAFRQAVECAPYCHAKLSTTKVSGDPDAPVQTVTRIELVAPSLVSRSD